MLEVICPRDGTVHHADEAHRGKMLRCADDGVTGQVVLTIDNRTGQDALVNVLLTSGAASHVAREVYVTSDSKLDLKHLTSGSYTVVFSLGNEWDPNSKGFMRDASFFRFGHVLGFSETENSESVLYSHEEIALQTLPSGNVPRVSISKADFEGR